MNELTNLLLQEGILTPEQAGAVEKRTQRNGQPTEDAVLALGFCQEGLLYQALSRLSGLSLLDPAKNPPSPEALAKLPPEMVQKMHCLPMDIRDGVLDIAFLHIPSAAQMDQFRLLLGMPCRACLAPPSAFQTQLQKSYGLGAETVRKLRGHKSVQAMTPPREEAVETLGKKEDDPDSVTGLVDEILEAGLAAGATDIHLEPFPGMLKIRFRLDGFLQDVPTPPGIDLLGQAIVSRIKVLAHLDIAEKRLPQDGRLRIQSRDGGFRDLRVSTLPTRHGETLCLRILNGGNLMMDLRQLGLSQEHLDRLQAQVRRPNGLLLVTGPTGSGKTTTLYSVLSHLMGERPDLKIITVEDPVEYDIPGITQVQTHAEIGLTFSATLRSILRHDPDVILVGEIRDSETAEIAIQAALTGHLVLSTLHTNDAVGAVSRLVNMGVEPDLVASALKCVIAQRLLRRLCPHCSQADPNPSPEDLRALQATAQGLGMPFTAPKMAAPGGCSHCRNTGYQGRVGVYEFLEMDEILEDLVTGRTPNAVLRENARKHGWRPYAEDAYRKVLLGITDLSELHRTC